MARDMARTDWIERAAVGASLLCMVHCLALPLLVAALPALASLFAIPESFHVWVLAFAIPAAAVALIEGRVRHGSVAPLAVGAAGLVSMAVAIALFEGRAAETWLTVAGSLLLAGAHLANWRMRHRHA